MERLKKGKSLIAFPDDYTIIDLETTGFSPQYDEIIELAAIKVRNGEIIDSFQKLIKPKGEISSFISELTGITSLSVNESPYIEEQIKNFVSFIGNDIVVGHNVNFDINFVYDNLLKIDNIYFENNYIDTMRIGKKLLPKLRHHRLIDFMEYFDIQEEQHRALLDCEITFNVFNELKKLAIYKYLSIDDFYKSFKKKHYSKSNSLKDLTASTNEFDDTHPLYGKVCVFTGTLEKYTRKEVAQIVLNYGGIIGDSVTKNTNFLVLGNNDYCQSIKDGKSSKQKKAETYIQKGMDLIILPENEFYEMLDTDDNSKNLYINEMEIFNRIKNNIDEKYTKIVNLKLKSSKTTGIYFITVDAKPTSWRANASEKTLAKIKIGRDISYISFAPEYKNIFKKYFINYTKTKSENAIRISFSDFKNIPSNVLTELLTTIMISSFKFDSFGCCGKYRECKEKGYCVHNDILYANACQYRKIITKEA